MSTFERARHLFATISGREQYTDPGEKFENITLARFRPNDPSVTLLNCDDGRVVTESEYLEMLRAIHNQRNPHSLVKDDAR